MKVNSLFIMALCAAVPALACAKKPKNVEAAPAPAAQTAAQEEEPTITEDCIVNVSLFNESVKNKQFADAYGPWWEVYNTCPNANKAIYTQGSKIIDWKYANTTDPAEKERLRQLILEMHDKRIKYFGDDPKYPTAYILGQKALDYCQYFPEDELKEPAYQWFKQSVEGMGVKSQMQVLAKFVDVSYAIFKSNPDLYGGQFISDYELASELLAQQAADPSNKNAKYAAQQKDYVDNIFAVSGAADCSKLDEIYAKVVADNADNLDMLTKVAALYKRVKCTESDIYFAACENAHRLQPTEESAAGCARMSVKKGDFRTAINYYEEAISRAQAIDPQDEDIADYQYNIALIYYSDLKNYPQARAYARQSLASKEDQGRCYILIGLCYAGSQPYSTADYPAAKAAILNKTVFWAAVDKFVQAKRVDPSCAADADKLIAAYSKYYPTKEEKFDLPNELGGSTFYVGGWIGETTVCR
ncbi:MAG: tetratricopeptide repeat protein [Paludibacteraceae bacterium]|nr:tetratricopeptide repeat protein [Bacteroidales bacterium]MDY4149078.1 tetratricopeptide repeat protein [Paludibacteraceae bacterium]